MLKAFIQISRLLAIIFFSLDAYASNDIEKIQKTYNIINFSSERARELKTIKAIVQDQHGFIWFATNVGLVRFDGDNFKKYTLKTTDNNNQIKVKSLLIDSNNILWVGTEVGLLKYHEENEFFQKVALKVNSEHLMILTLLEDQHQNIWVGTRDHGLFKIKPEANNPKTYSTVHFFKNSPKQHQQLSSDAIRSLYQTSDGHIWIGTINGLNRYSVETDRINKYKVALPQTPLHNLTVHSILEYKDKLLLGSNRGLIEFSQKTATSLIYSNEKVLNSTIYALKMSFDNKLLIGSKFNGLLIHSLITKKTQKNTILNDNHSQGSGINSNMIFAIYSDNSGNIWLGTNIGINKLTYSANAIELYRQQNNNSQCIASNENHAIYLDSQENLWIGARGKGLNKINYKTGYCTLLTNKNIKLASINFNLIMDIKEDLQGNIWIASYDEGLIKYEPKTKTFKQLHFDDVKGNQLIQQGSVLGIEVDENNNLWLAMLDHGLVKYDQKKHVLQMFGDDIAKEYQQEKLTIRSIEYIDNTLWLGTHFLGLLSFDIATNKTQHFPLSNKGNIITSSIDKNKNLWLGTNDYGVFKFDLKTQQYTHHYQAKDGLANNDIFNIQVDNNNNIWIGTYNGLSMFNQSTSAFTNYYKKDGLQSNDSSLGSFFDKKTGFLWLGGMNGINRINTNTLNKKNEDSSLYLTNLKINGENITVNNKQKSSPLKENIISAKQLTLTHKQNNFAFNFANINYQNTDKLSYQYRLAGYDQWTDVDSKNLSANYTNIPAGHYQFKVRVTNNSGQWNANETSINITILPPWWLTTLALVIYALLLLLAIYSVIHFRTRTLKNKADELEKSICERTVELAEEKEKVIQLLEQKNEEFANLSHEFRTPLTLILGTSSQLLSSNLTEKQLNRIEVIKRNGYRLLRMVDQLLHIETFRVKAFSQKSLQHTGSIISQLLDAFTDLALEKGIELQVIHIEDISFELVQDALEKIVVNLLSNAIKYTDNGGSITLETKRTANNELFIQIVDTGRGIPEDQLDSIFEKYNRVLNKGSEQITGAGIGLALIKELIQSHSGSIHLTSQLESGTCITVLLPIVNEIYKESTHELVLANKQTDNIVSMELMSLTQQSTSNLPLAIIDSDTQKNENLKILIIEDNHDMSEYMTSCFADNYLVISAFDGLEGVKLANQEVPDLIICDVMMPKLDGYQTTKKIRENPITNHIPIILLTSRHDLESKLKGWHHQVDEYLTKPFIVEELKVRIDNLLSIRNILKNRHNKMVLRAAHTNQDILEKITDTSTIEQMKKQEIFIEKLNQTLEKHYTDTTITVNTIARSIAMSERQLFRKLKSVLGMTPTEYLRRFRLEKSCLLLAQGESAINTAFDTGFSSQSYFGKCFKNEYGYPPSEFTKHLQRNKESVNTEYQQVD
jgi:ligand-binding sensor domain-containing protein/signal transduction histidine kinase/DNA-binding response OmpR family regulator